MHSIIFGLKAALNVTFGRKLLPTRKVHKKLKINKTTKTIVPLIFLEIKIVPFERHMCGVVLFVDKDPLCAEKELSRSLVFICYVVLFVF